MEITTAQNGYQSEDNNTFDGSNTSHVNASAEDQHQGTAENLYQVNLPPRYKIHTEIERFLRFLT